MCLLWNGRYTLSEAEAVTHGARCLDGTPARSSPRAVMHVVTSVVLPLLTCVQGTPYTFYTSHRHPIHILPMPRDWIVYLNGGGECDKVAIKCGYVLGHVGGMEYMP